MIALIVRITKHPEFLNFDHNLGSLWPDNVDQFFPVFQPLLEAGFSSCVPVPKQHWYTLSLRALKLAFKEVGKRYTLPAWVFPLGQKPLNLTPPNLAWGFQIHWKNLSIWPLTPSKARAKNLVRQKFFFLASWDSPWFADSNELGRWPRQRFLHPENWP